GGRATSGEGGARGRRPGPAALAPLVPPGRCPSLQGHGGDARPGQQAAAPALARRRGPRRAPPLRPYLAVGARLRERRSAYRPAATAVALADEAARPRGGGAAADGARGRPPGAAPGHV